MIYVSPNKTLFIDFNFVLIVNFVNCSVFVHICLNMSLSVDIMYSLLTVYSVHGKCCSSVLYL